MHQRSAFPMQRDNKREQPPRRVAVAIDLAFQPLQEKFRRLVVNRTPAHVDRLDLRRHRGSKIAA